MKRRLDRALPAAALALLLALCLGACGPRSAADRVGRALNLTISHARARVSTDSHGGLSRDGTACTVLQALDGSLLEQIRTDGRWRPLPMDKTTRILAYGYDDGITSIGPYLGEVELPEIQTGYYRLIDRHSDTDTDILDRYSFNFTLGVYDSDTNTLYCCEVDT